MVGYGRRGARKRKGRRAVFSSNKVYGLILCCCLKTETPDSSSEVKYRSDPSITVLGTNR